MHNASFKKSGGKEFSGIEILSQKFYCMTDQSTFKKLNALAIGTSSNKPLIKN